MHVSMLHATPNPDPAELVFTDADRERLAYLARAMTQGATLRPQAFSAPFAWDSDLGTYRSCALGATYEGLGYAPAVAPPYPVAQKLGEVFPILNHRVLFPVIVHGDEHTLYYSLRAAITDLNDQQRWTREQIAAWLLTL